MTEDGGQTKRTPLRSFEDLEVFQRAYRASLDIHSVTLDFPAIEQRALADQLRRSSKSICAMLAEGWGKHGGSPAEFRRYVLMAIGSAEEVRVWLRYAVDLGYIDQARWEAWREDYKIIARMLQSLHGRWS